MEIKLRTFCAILAAVSIYILAVTLTGCTNEANKVSQNIAKEADNFNVYRRVVIINTRTDKIEFEVIGKMSVTIGSNRIDLIIEDDGKYYKHIINLTDNNMYVVEDLGGSEVSKYKYEINYIPEMLVPIKFTSND